MSWDEGFVVGLAVGRKKNSGGSGKRYDPVFHDILENSEAFCTINIDDVYKFTLNLWVTSRGDVPYCKYRDFTPLAAVESEGVGYDQTPVIYTRSAFIFRILWKNDKPMYAAYAQNSELPRDFPRFVDIHESLDVSLPFKYYIYRDVVHEYIKGSAAAPHDPQLYIKPVFKESMYGAKFLNLGNIQVVDADGNPTAPGCTYKLKKKTYKAVYGETEWTNPSNGQTSTVKDYTKPPKIVLDKESEETYGIEVSNYRSDLNIFSCANVANGTIYSDLPEAELNGLTDELIKAICEKYGDKSCYTHIPAEWLKPEKEESI